MVELGKTKKEEKNENYHKKAQFKNQDFTKKIPYDKRYLLFSLL